jgi:ABC-type multidrug transport system ATPase subunit
LIGNLSIKGLSGGERKRTAIGVEMVTDPSLLFLDEPTSGLDSFNANKIVKLLVNQARKGMTVVATIHQPSSGTYSLFDKLLLLMDGNTIFQGNAKDAADYFDSLNFKVPKFVNPADYFLKEFYVPFKRTDKDDQKIIKLVK